MNDLITVISVTQDLYGEREVKQGITSTSDTWPELLMDFAILLNTFGDEDTRFYIDLDILRKHIDAAAKEQTLKFISGVVQGAADE